MLVETLRVPEVRAQILASKHLWAQSNRTRKLARASRSSERMQGRLTSRSWSHSSAFKTYPCKIPLLREFPGKTQTRRRHTLLNTTVLSSVNKDHRVSLEYKKCLNLMFDTNLRKLSNPARTVVHSKRVYCCKKGEETKDSIKKKKFKEKNIGALDYAF